MYGISYNPAVLRSIFSYAYSSQKQLLNKNSQINELLSIKFLSGSYANCIPVLPKENLKNIFYLFFNPDSFKWIFYHCNDKWNNYAEIKKILFLLDDNSYLTKYLDTMVYAIGYVCSNKIHFISLEGHNGAIPIVSYSCYADLENNILYKKIKPTVTTSIFQNSNIYMAEELVTYTDILTPVNGGIAHINSGLAKDLIFITFKISSHSKYVRECLEILTSKNYYGELYPALGDLTDRLLSVITGPPKDNYNSVYQLFRANDGEYFNTKMGQFQHDVLQIFNKINILRADNSPVEYCNFISDFIAGFKKDICFELNTVYHRLRCFPQERIKIYKKFPNHPYIKLCKLIHQYFVEQRAINKSYKITTQNIYNFLTKNDKTNLIIYDDQLIILINAIKNRSSLFVPWYKIYLNSVRENIKPKFTVNKSSNPHYYYPFKVFYARLFIMEHFLALE